MGKKESANSLKEKLEEWKKIKREKQEEKFNRQKQNIPAWSAGTKPVSVTVRPETKPVTVQPETKPVTVQPEKTKLISRTDDTNRKENKVPNRHRLLSRRTSKTNSPKHAKPTCKISTNFSRIKSDINLQRHRPEILKPKDQISMKRQVSVCSAGTKPVTVRHKTKLAMCTKEDKVPSRSHLVSKHTTKTTIAKSTCKTSTQISPKKSGIGLQQHKPAVVESNNQVSMRHHLNGWLKAKGKTPSKFRHLMCFGAEMSARKSNQECQAKRAITVDELTEQQKTLEKEAMVTVNLEKKFLAKTPVEEKLCLVANPDEQLQTMLNECLTLFEAGCPHNDILAWLNSIEQNVSLARHSTHFYVTKVKVLRSREDVNTEEVLAVLETAIRNSAKPIDVLASFVTRTVKEMLSSPAQRESMMLPAATMMPRKTEVESENIFYSSSVKFCLKDITPLKKRGRRSIDSLYGDAPRCVVTPVRRSTRRSLATLPETLQDKQHIFSSIRDISASDLEHALFQKNTALYQDSVPAKE